MAINENWSIRSRAHECSQTGRKFIEGEIFYTALFENKDTGELQRRDFSVESWKLALGSLDPQPFSFWKTKYQPPPNQDKPGSVAKESAESLLRKLLEEDSPLTENTRYVLAVMLERKKTLKQTATRETESDTFLIYEHVKTGEVIIVRDPDLKLWELEPVQREVARLLGGEDPPKNP